MDPHGTPGIGSLPTRGCLWGGVIGVEASATPARHVPDHVARHSWGGVTVETAQGGVEQEEATKIHTEKARRKTEETNRGGVEKEYGSGMPSLPLEVDECASLTRIE